MSVQLNTLLFGISGGFVAGLVVPHEGGFAIRLVEKFEDLVSIVLIPLVRRVRSDRSPYDINTLYRG